MSRLHRNDTKGYHSLAIDINNGIFMVVKKSTGLVSPIHVQKSKKLQKFVCTNQSCSDMMNAAKEKLSRYRMSTFGSNKVFSASSKLQNERKLFAKNV